MDTSTIFTVICTILGSGIGAFLTHIFTKYSNKIQKIECSFTDEDILSKIPQKDENNTLVNNVYCKTFKVKNTTNIDIKSMEIIFQFDPTSTIMELYSTAKDGYNKQKIKKSKIHSNEAHAYIELFNRDDEIEYVFKIANVTDNNYYISESKCLGIKIICKDKRKANIASKANRTTTLLINKSI